MGWRVLWSIVGVMLLVGSGAAVEAKEKNHNHLLRGDYAFSGEATCLVSPDGPGGVPAGGFNLNLTPFGPPARFPFVISFSIQGVRTFNGDGTGTVVARIVSISHPSTIPSPVVSPYTPSFNRGGAGSFDIQSDFTYEVAPDLTFTIHTPLVTGTFDAGTRVGQTITITGLPPFAGRISKDHRTLTLAHEEAGVQTNTFSNGDAHHEICHRSRILLEQKR